MRVRQEYYASKLKVSVKLVHSQIEYEISGILSFIPTLIFHQFHSSDLCNSNTTKEDEAGVHFTMFPFKKYSTKKYQIFMLAWTFEKLQSYLLQRKNKNIFLKSIQPPAVHPWLDMFGLQLGNTRLNNTTFVFVYPLARCGMKFMKLSACNILSSVFT